MTLVPEQITFPGFGDTLTAAVTVGVTTMIIEFDITGFIATQLTPEVITQITVSLFASEEVV